MWTTAPAFFKSLVVALISSVPVRMQYGFQFIILAETGSFRGLCLALLTIMALSPQSGSKCEGPTNY